VTIKIKMKEQTYTEPSRADSRRAVQRPSAAPSLGGKITAAGSSSQTSHERRQHQDGDKGKKIVATIGPMMAISWRRREHAILRQFVQARSAAA